MKLPWMLVPIIALVLAGCTGSGSSENGHEPSGTPDPLASDPAAALHASAERFAANIQSGRAKFDWDIERQGFHVSGNGTYAFRSPEGLDLETHYTGEGSLPTQFRERNDSQVRVAGGAAYVKTPALHDGWVSFTPDEFAADWAVTQRLISNHSPLDFAAVVSSAVGVEVGGQESIDGRQYLRISAEVDAGTLMSALADAYGSQGQMMIANRFSGPIPVVAWLDATTLLPRRLEAEGEFSYFDGVTRLKLAVEFAELNEFAGVIEVPADATPFQVLLAGR